MLRFRSVVALSFLVFSTTAFGQNRVGTILVQDPTGQMQASLYSGTESHEIIEYHDGDDATTRYRPGRQKAGTITIRKDWSNTGEFFTNYVQDALSGGMLARKSISIVMLDNSGAELQNQSFAMFGDTAVSFPATGSYASDPSDQIAVTFASYLHSNNIIHRDLAARNFLVPSGFQVNVSDFGTSRVMDVTGTSSFAVRVATGDLDGDGYPDVVTNISATHVTMTVGADESSFVQKWDSDTSAAGAAGVPNTHHFSFLWFTRDGSDYRVDFDATLVSATPVSGGTEIECAVERVKFTRDALKN